MATSVKTKDLRTQAFVLRRTNYGETDRILNLLTPEGKIAVLAKGVRREKSKLAGGIELFSLSDVTIHSGKSELGILTSARTVRHYGAVATDLARLTLASEVLKQINRATEQVYSPEYFEILKQVLAALDEGYDLELVETWFWLNFARVRGEELNLYYDASGARLQAETTYVWDSTENALRAEPRGNVGAEHIKLMRLILSNSLTVVARVRNLSDLLPPVNYIAKALNQL